MFKNMLKIQKLKFQVKPMHVNNLSMQIWQYMFQYSNFK
jgi:hypothetical protein